MRSLNRIFVVMNKRLLHIVLLLAAAVSFVAHAAVVHHHHLRTVCLDVVCECMCPGECGTCDGCDGCHDGDTCREECVAFALFELPHSHDDESVAASDLPDSGPVPLSVEDVRVAAVCAGCLLSCDDAMALPRRLIVRSLSLRAPPVGLYV